MAAAASQPGSERRAPCARSQNRYRAHFIKRRIASITEYLFHTTPIRQP